MKRIIFLITIILLHINCWAQGNKNIIQLDIYAVSFTAAYYAPLPEFIVREPYSVYLKVHYEPFKESRIHEYLTKLNPDTEAKLGDVDDYRAIMTVMYDDMTKSTFYITRRRIANNGKVYMPHNKLIRAIYSLLPKSFSLEDRERILFKEDERDDDDE